MFIGEGGSIGSDAEADVTYLGGEPTMHAFTPEHVVQAQRFEYRADESGVTFALVESTDALITPQLVLTVARQTAAALNTDAAQPGVTGIQETQTIDDLGSINDVFEVAMRSTSGKTLQTYTVQPADMRADVFAPIAANWRAQLDAYEAT